MFLKYLPLLDGPGPSETIVAVTTWDGTKEEVIVDKSLVTSDGLDVGPVITEQKDRTLVELPRESASGRLRIWVNNSDIRQTASA